MYYCRYSLFYISDNFFICKAYHSIVTAVQIPSPISVSLTLRLIVVIFSIYLYYKIIFQINKVNNINSYYMLPAKVNSKLVAPYFLPQHLFCQSQSLSVLRSFFLLKTIRIVVCRIIALNRFFHTLHCFIGYAFDSFAIFNSLLAVMPFGSSCNQHPLPLGGDWGRLVAPLHISYAYDVSKHSGSRDTCPGTIALYEHRVLLIALGGQHDDIVAAFKIIERAVLANRL